MFEYFVYNYGTEIIGLLMAAIMGCIGNAMRLIYRKYVNDQTKVAIARAVVQFVEQAWKTLHGKDKLEKALETAEVLLRKKRIPFDAEEMMVLIEAAVAEFNDAFRKPANAQDTAAAKLGGATAYEDAADCGLPEVKE